jgi:S-formylglutathione hydrolase FrmB
MARKLQPSKQTNWVLNYQKIKRWNDEKLIQFINNLEWLRNEMPADWESEPHRYHIRILRVMKDHDDFLVN